VAAGGQRTADRDPHHRLAQPQIVRHRTGGAQSGGYVEGRNLSIELRHGDGQYDRLPAFAADLIQRQVAVLVTTGGARVAQVAQAATTTIPIVFTTGSDPVQDRLVKSINRPGGNSTGVYLLNNSLAPKRLEVLRELVPNARVIAFLVNPHNLNADEQIREAQTAANSIGVELQVLKASTAREIDSAFETLLQRGAKALLRLRRATRSRRSTNGPSSSGLAGWSPTVSIAAKPSASLASMSVASSTAPSLPSFRSCRRANSSWSST